MLIQNQAYNDAKAAAVINETVTEAKKYNKAVIIFDLDSISGIKKEYQSLKEDLKVSNILALEGGENACAFTYAYEMGQSFKLALNFMKNASKKGPIWYIAVSQNNKVILDLKQVMKWPHTPSEDAYEE